eukprot:1160520-Pelagomonas_calceolata.AAC.6
MKDLGTHDEDAVVVDAQEFESAHSDMQPRLVQPRHSMQLKVYAVKPAQEFSLLALGKRDILAQRAVSLPHQKMRGKFMRIGWVSGNTLLQGTSVVMS